MVKFEALLGQLSIHVTDTNMIYSPNSGSMCQIRGVLCLIGRDLLGPGDAKTTWEVLGYEIGIQHFKITFDAPASNYRVSYTDQPVHNLSAREQLGDSTMITWSHRQWAQNGQIALGFSMAVPKHSLPPRGMACRYQLAASVTVAIVNKDLGKGPDFMHRIAAPVSFEISHPPENAAWPWTQRNGLN